MSRRIVGDRLGHVDHARLDEHGCDADGAVAAHRQAAADLDVDDAPVGVRTGRRLQDRAAHRAVPARLVHQQRAQVVELGDDVRRRSTIVSPGITPTPPVTTRVGMPSVCESTRMDDAAATASARARCAQRGAWTYGRRARTRRAPSRWPHGPQRPARRSAADAAAGTARRIGPRRPCSA